MKQFQLFSSLVLQADNTALIPPHMILDREAQGFNDLREKYGCNIKTYS
jgi:hypothetical protein